MPLLTEVGMEIIVFSGCPSGCPSSVLPSHLFFLTQYFCILIYQVSGKWEKGLQVLRSKVKVQINGREIIIIINEYH